MWSLAEKGGGGGVQEIDSTGEEEEKKEKVALRRLPKSGTTEKEGERRCLYEEAKKRKGIVPGLYRRCVPRGNSQIKWPKRENRFKDKSKGGNESPGKEKKKCPKTEGKRN